jgi:tetratricopeptide (TPR) repeat protein
MTDLTSVEIPKPKDWQAFERHCRLLFERSLNDPAVQNNGRSGQRQHGVDIFGHRGSGTGRLVGIQCKGKDSDYGHEVSEAELKAEIEKTKKFKPALQEFILVTTAPDDAKIQQAARLLEEKVRAEGRDLSIQVWGWGRVQQEINRFTDVVTEFHPDATIFTQTLIEGIDSTKRLVAEGHASHSAEFAELKQMVASLARAPISTEHSKTADAFDKELHNQIDGYRDLLREGKPRTALQLLKKMNDRLGADAPPRVRYRLLSNIGAAHYNLGEYDEAADFLLKAAPLNPDDAISLANKAAALLIKGRKQEAHEIAVAAIAAYPDSHEIALQRIQALGADETVESVWASLSATAKSVAAVFGFRVGVLREKDDLSWWSLAEEGVRLFPDDQGLRIFKADSIIDRVLKRDPGGVGLGNDGVPTEEELTGAAEQLETYWKNSQGGETPPQPVLAHNGALAWNLIGNVRRAALLLDEAMAAGYGPDETKQLRISLYRREDKIPEAIRLADALADSPMHRLMRADLRVDTAPAEAREIVRDFTYFSRTTDRIAASLVTVETYIKENNFEFALAEARALEAAWPTHPQGPLSSFRVRKARGDADAASELDRALALVNETTDFPTRFLVAEALGSVNRYDDVMAVLSQHTARNFDSPALRALVAAAVNADRRATLKGLFKEMPPAVLAKRFYARARVAFSIHSGNIRQAEDGLRAFLKSDPSSLEFHLQLLQALFRQNKMQELREAVAVPAAQLKGAPKDFLMLAHFKDDFGDWHEAHQIAYQMLLAHPNDQAVAMGYIGIFLRPGHSRELNIEAPTVQPDRAIGLIVEGGPPQVYIVEPNATLRPSPQHIGSDHRIAQLLQNKAVGEAVELPDGTKAKIGLIKPKVLHALHDLLENFKNRFPDATGLEKINIEPGKEGAFDEIFERLREKHDATEQIAGFYDTGSLPLELVGRSLGCDSIEAMAGLASTGHDIRVCEGSHIERDTAANAILANARKGCVVDALTLHVIRRLKLEAAVIGVCGPIHIVDETSLLVQRKVHELKERLDEPGMSLSWRDGQAFRQETTPQEKREILRVYEDDQQWLAANAVIIPAEGNRDPSPEWKPLIERFGSGFLDEIRAAQGPGLIFLSEDYLLRTIARLDFGVQGTWLQPVLMLASQQKMITRDEYRRAIAFLIDAGFHFISISPDLIVEAVRGAAEHTLPREFEALASRIGGKTADIESHFSVALRAARAIWVDDSISWTVRQGAYGRLLERLITDRSPIEVQAILGLWIEEARRFERNMFSYISGWLRGHFIELRLNRPRTGT